jgi:uncharacterized protein YdaU (DUF1376 family)
LNYYNRHIGDYAAATRHLSILEHGAYTMLLDVYYTTEQPLPVDVKLAARKAGARSKEDIAAVEVVLSEFFTLAADGWRHARCDAEIAAYQAKAETNKVNGKRGGRPKREPTNNPDGFQKITHTVSTALNSRNHVVTLTNNQEPITNKQGASVKIEEGGPSGPTHADFENIGSGSGPGSEAAAAMLAAGLADVSATHPKLLALLDAGLSVAELRAAAVYAVGKGVGFAYALSRAEGQRRDAAAMAALPDAPTAAAQDPDSVDAVQAEAERHGLARWVAGNMDAQGRHEPWPVFKARVRRAQAEAVGVTA